MYVDKGARFTLLAAEGITPGAQPATDVPGTDAPDFEHTTWMSASGALVGASLRGSAACADPPILAGAAGARRRLVPSEYATIQAAIDAAAAGDIVAVEQGVYRENLRMRSNVSLSGAGATLTTLEGGGQAASLIDFTGAKNVVVQGFTLTGVGSAMEPLDPFAGSGNWYAAAIFGDGHLSPAGGSAQDDPCIDTSILVTQNIIRDNAVGVMTYFHARAVVQNNLFVANRYAFVANHLQDHALLVNNAFFANEEVAIGSQAGYLDVVGNIIAGSQVAVSHEFVQTGRISCNGFASNGSAGERVPLGQQGNIELEHAFVDAAAGDFRPTPDLLAALAGCLLDPSLLAEWATADPGAFGGILGRWTTRPFSP
jgi:hypothetical protein